MGKFFVGSKGGDDAKYLKREAAMASQLAAPPEFSSNYNINREDLDLLWLEAKVQELFVQFLNSDDEITANMFAASVQRGDDPRQILANITTLSDNPKAAYKLMQALWISLETAPTKKVLTAKGKDEISLLREKVVANLEKKKASTEPVHKNRTFTTTTTTRSNPANSSANHKDFRTRPQSGDQQRRRSRSPRRSPRIEYHNRQSASIEQPSLPDSYSAVPYSAASSATNWEKLLRDKAWKAVNASRKL